MTLTTTRSLGNDSPIGMNAGTENLKRPTWLLLLQPSRDTNIFSDLCLDLQFRRQRLHVYYMHVHYIVVLVAEGILGGLKTYI